MYLFYEHVHNLLDENISAIEEKSILEKKRILQENDLGKVQSFYSTYLFSCINNMLTVLASSLKGDILFQVVKILLDKVKSIQRKQIKEIECLDRNDQLIICCVFVNDADNCLEMLKAFKKEVKGKILETYLPSIKAEFGKVKKLMFQTVNVGVNKAVELVMLESEETVMRQYFTGKWDKSITEHILENFQIVYKNGFERILENDLTKIQLVRTFASNFLYYYLEELVFTVRSFKKKKFNGTKLKRYKLQYLKADKEELAVKELNDSDKRLTDFSANLEADKVIFERFLVSLGSQAKEPFFEGFDFNITENFTESLILKVRTVEKIVSCSQDEIKDNILFFYKPMFEGEFGLVLLETILFVREDGESLFKQQELLKYFTNLYTTD